MGSGSQTIFMVAHFSFMIMGSPSFSTFMNPLSLLARYFLAPTELSFSSCPQLPNSLSIRTQTHIISLIDILIMIDGRVLLLIKCSVSVGTLCVWWPVKYFDNCNISSSLAASQGCSFQNLEFWQAKTIN